MIFLASDGIVDSFLSVENFKNFVNDAKIYDLQKYVDNVVFDAENLNTKHPDDMTIIAVKLLKNNQKWSNIILRKDYVGIFN